MCTAARMSVRTRVEPPWSTPPTLTVGGVTCTPARVPLRDSTESALVPSPLLTAGSSICTPDCVPPHDSIGAAFKAAAAFDGPEASLSHARLRAAVRLD